MKKLITYVCFILCVSGNEMMQGPCDQSDYPLYGHSLSWTDEKEHKRGPNNTLVAKLWVPEPADITEFPPQGSELTMPDFSNSL